MSKKLSDFLNNDGTVKRGCAEDAADMRLKIKSLQNVGLKNGIAPDILLLMINKNFGLIWDTIPEHRFEDLRIWVNNNSTHWLGIIAPDVHYQLLQCLKQAVDIKKSQVFTEVKQKLETANCKKSI